ncbi:MAG: MarR family transcriptional regulator [Propionibacteriaceae bacterium]|nr:MarR family transcriptional regulator [Propionibacteriaceae bacterium]
MPTAPQYAVLTVVAGTDRPDMQDVGSVASLDKTTLTGVARRLERDGWILRYQDPGDRRRFLLKLTASGAIALRQTAPLAAEAQIAFLAPVPSQDHERLIQLLRQLCRLSATPPSGADISMAAWQEMTTSPGHLIRRAQQAHTAHWQAEFGQELTGPQHSVIRMVGLQTRTTHSRLTELAALDKATLSSVVNRLVQIGFLSTQTDQHDRRVRWITLTNAGREMFVTAQPRVQRVQAELAAPLVDEDRPWLQEVLEKLAFRSGAPEVDIVTTGATVSPGE